MILFEKLLSITEENIEFLANITNIDIPWSDFWLNPRRLRGSDFLMRWSQGVWSEKRILEAINKTDDFYAIAYGPSGVAPSDNVREYELYFERLEAVGLGKIKRPDLLIFKKENQNKIDQIVNKLGGQNELPFLDENQLKEILDQAIFAVECENSLWVAQKMPDFNTPLKPMKRLGGKLGLKKNAVLPTVIIKEEDQKPLLEWQNINKIKIHVWQVFYDRAYGLSLDESQRLINEGLIEATDQTFQAPGGATTQKAIYKFYYHYAYPLGKTIDQPQLIPDFVEDKNGHILPYVKFAGGTLKLIPETLEMLKTIRNDRT
jgi:hypothetical protein